MSEMSKTALFLENIHRDADHALKSLGNIDISRHSGSLNANDLIHALEQKSILGIRSRTQITQDILKNAPCLQAIGCFCIGTNQVDIESTKQLGIPVFNAPFANTRSVAELTMASIIMLMRRVPEKMFGIKSGRWLKTAKGATEVRKKKLGIIGYGNIGTQLSVLASALGMHVYFYDISPKLAHGNARPVQTLPLLLEQCDVVTLHVPSTHKTKNMISENELKIMKPGSFLINHARGDLVDIMALSQAISNGHIAGAAIDVFPLEPKNEDEVFDSPLLACQNVILTPHIGGSTLEAQAAIGSDAASKLAKYLFHGCSQDAVNFPNLDPGPVGHGCIRACVYHFNQPGFLSRLNSAVGKIGVNISAQYLQTQSEFGYAIADIECTDVALLRQIKNIEGAIRVRFI